MPDPSQWVYTATGELPPRKVEIRHQVFLNTVWLNNSRDTVLDIECVKEPAPDHWPDRNRFSVVMIGLGQQRKKDFHVIQYASDWERDLLDAARPMLGLAGRILIEARGDFDTEVLAGRWVSSRRPCWTDAPLWPALDLRSKTLNVRSLIQEQEIDPQVDRTGDISGKDVLRMWPDKARRESVWRHNFLDVIETSMKIFQIEDM